MKKFMHFADAHIGHRQYGLKMRRDDMYRSFKTAINQGIDENIDFAVFSGDLFHHKKVNARALRDAEKCFDIFHENDVPVIVIQGNHDSKLYKEDLTWLEYLHSKGKIILLEGDFTEDGPIYEKHEFEEPGTSSGFVDLDGVRIFGLQYSGQRTSERLNMIKDEIERVNEEYGEPQSTILMGHFGVGGHIPGMGGEISYNDIAPFEELVNYLALGHIHKRYNHDNWVFNPGSLEAHDTREAKQDMGYYIVRIVDDGSIDAEHRLSKRRPFYTIEFSVEGYSDNAELLDGFEKQIKDEIDDFRAVQEKEHYKARGEKRDSIVDLRLKGLLQFSRSVLDIDKLIDIVEEKMDVIKVQPSDATESIRTKRVLEEVGESEDEIFDGNGQLDRERLEGAVFQMKVGEDSRYRDKKEGVSQTLMAVKNMLLSDESPERIKEDIRKKRKELFSEGGE